MELSLTFKYFHIFPSYRSQCKWKHTRRGFEFSSDGGTSSRDNEIVSLGRTPDSRLDNMCYFTINSVSYDHNGDWECTLYSECDDTDHDDDGTEDGFFQGRRRRQVRDRRCKAADPDCSKDDYCNNQASQIVRVGVFSQDDIGIVSAQSTYHANVGTKASLNDRLHSFRS